MADKKNVTMAQFKLFAEKADERLDKLELARADGVASVRITIPASAWTANTDVTTTAAGFAFCAEVAVESLTAEDSADTTLDYSSLRMAKACGMATTATAVDGAVRYYAVEQPQSDMSATVRVFQGKRK